MTKIFEVDALTGEGVLRDMTKEEIAAVAIDAERFAKQAREEAAAAKIAEASKNAILEKLGITSEEAALLLK